MTLCEVTKKYIPLELGVILAFERCKFPKQTFYMSSPTSPDSDSSNQLQKPAARRCCQLTPLAPIQPARCLPLLQSVVWDTAEQL